MRYMEKIKALRKAHGINQTQMGELLQTTQQQYYKYENEKQELPIRHLVTICYYFNVTPNYLLGFED